MVLVFGQWLTESERDVYIRRDRVSIVMCWTKHPVPDCKEGFVVENGGCPLRNVGSTNVSVWTDEHFDQNEGVADRQRWVSWPVHYGWSWKVVGCSRERGRFSARRWCVEKLRRTD